MGDHAHDGAVVALYLHLAFRAGDDGDRRDPVRISFLPLDAVEELGRARGADRHFAGDDIFFIVLIVRSLKSRIPGDCSARP